jgi:hypothetical protein
MCVRSWKAFWSTRYVQSRQHVKGTYIYVSSLMSQSILSYSEVLSECVTFTQVTLTEHPDKKVTFVKFIDLFFSFLHSQSSALSLNIMTLTQPTRASLSHVRSQRGWAAFWFLYSHPQLLQRLQNTKKESRIRGTLTALLGA